MQERYLPSELYKDPKAEPKNFKREQTGRDRFGNRFITSADLAYSDRADNKVKAGLLISPEGEALIKNNPGLLQDIEKALHNFEISKEQPKTASIDLGQEKALRRVTHGGQSNFYILTVREEKYAIKTHVKKEREMDRLDQPYVNEMLQTQTLANDIKNDLDQLGVRMATFLFASGQVSCTKFEENERNYEALDMDKLRELKLRTLVYLIDKNLEGNELWKGVEIDLPIDSPKAYITAVNNFITKQDGTIVWIDPFKYDKTPYEPGQRYG